MSKKMLCVVSLVLALAGVGLCHEVPVDWSRECMPPAGAARRARTTARLDKATRSYVFTARDDVGRVTYRVTPGDGGGKGELFRVACRVGDGQEFVLTGGVMVAARTTDKVEVVPDGTIRVGAMGEVDVDADGPGGFANEPSGHGPCIRLGTGFPVAAHTRGFAVWRVKAAKGRYRVGVRYMDDRDDTARDSFIRLKLKGRVLGQWALTQNDDAWHERLFEADVAPGDVLRIEARTDDSGGKGSDFCRISHILLRPVVRRRAQAPTHSLAGGVLTIRRAADPPRGIPAVVASIALAGNSLRCHLRQDGAATSPAGITSLDVLRSHDTPGARIVRVPFVNEAVAMTRDGAFFTTYTDRFRSHCTKMRLARSVDTATGDTSVFGPRLYLPNSADALFPFNETLYLTASRRLLDVLPTFPARTPTPGRAALSGRVVFDHWRMAAGDGLEQQLRLMDACGMKQMLVLLHTWMRYGYDRKQPQFSPANPDRWTDKQFKSAIAACRAIDYRVAVHENYNHMDWDSPYNAPTPARDFGEPDRPGDPGPAEAKAMTTSCPGPDPARQPRNAWAFSRLADLRVSTGPLTRPSPPAFPIASDKALFYSQIESHKLKDMYGTTAGYLDVTPCNEPGMGTWSAHIDLDARNTQAWSWSQVYRNAVRLFAHHRDLFGITTGEGGHGATYYAGYIHAVERQIRGRTQAPIIPHFELTAVRPLSLHHGMGYFSRYFVGRNRAKLPTDFDLYRAMEIAFGHAGFIADTQFPNHLPGPDAVREYYLMQAVQAAYADTTLATVAYADGDRWLSVEEGLRRGYDFVQARIRLRYANGLEVAVNFGRKATWAVRVGGETFRLPPKGWAAVCPARSLRAGMVSGNAGIEEFVDCPAYVYRCRRGTQHPTAFRAAGLPGASGRTCPGALVCLDDNTPQDIRVDVPARFRTAKALNVTVVNPGDPAARRIALQGFRPRRQAAVAILRALGPGAMRHDTVWTPPKAGTWTLALAYRYTDPNHPEATKLELRDAIVGPPVTIAEQPPATTKHARGKARRNAQFVETTADLDYATAGAVGRPMRFTLARVQFGCGGPDDDFAEHVRLVLTHTATGKSVSVPFPQEPAHESRRLDTMASAFEFTAPQSSVVTFELMAR